MGTLQRASKAAGRQGELPSIQGRGLWRAFALIFFLVSTAGRLRKRWREMTLLRRL
jgi:hypothetical protein